MAGYEYAGIDNSTHKVTCRPVPLGSYKESIGNLEAIKCPPGSNTLSTASKSLSDCVCSAGYYLDQDSRVCQVKDAIGDKSNTDRQRHKESQNRKANPPGERDTETQKNTPMLHTDNYKKEAHRRKGKQTDNALGQQQETQCPLEERTRITWLLIGLNECTRYTYSQIERPTSSFFVFASMHLRILCSCQYGCSK